MSESRRVRRLRVMFGLAEREEGGPEPSAAQAAEALACMARGAVGLVTGASGAGKTSAMERLARELSARGEVIVRVREVEEARGAAIDVVRGAMGRAAAALALAGLGDARAMTRPIGVLSCGERQRLALARAMARARPGTWVLADEFCTSLDAGTARGVSMAAARWARSSGVRLVCATVRDELIESMSPDVLVWMDPGEPPLVLWKEDSDARAQGGGRKKREDGARSTAA